MMRIRIVGIVKYVCFEVIGGLRLSIVGIYVVVRGGSG